MNYEKAWKSLKATLEITVMVYDAKMIKFVDPENMKFVMEIIGMMKDIEKSMEEEAEKESNQEEEV